MTSETPVPQELYTVTITKKFDDMTLMDLIVESEKHIDHGDIAGRMLWTVQEFCLQTFGIAPVKSKLVGPLTFEMSFTFDNLVDATLFKLRWA